MPASLSRDAARRIANATRHYENVPRTALPAPSGPRVVIPTKFAIVTSAITAANRSSSTFGVGAGTLQVCKFSPSGVGTYVSSGITVPIYSGALAGSGVPIAVGRLVVVIMIDGRYQLAIDYC